MWGKEIEEIVYFHIKKLIELKKKYIFNHKKKNKTKMSHGPQKTRLTVHIYRCTYSA